jgi:hypothetical protein
MLDLNDTILRLVQVLNLNVAAETLYESDKKDALMARTPSALDFIKHEETKRFWKDFFGQTVCIIYILFLIKNKRKKGGRTKKTKKKEKKRMNGNKR